MEALEICPLAVLLACWEAGARVLDEMCLAVVKRKVRARSCAYGPKGRPAVCLLLCVWGVACLVHVLVVCFVWLMSTEKEETESKTLLGRPIVLFLHVFC